MPFQLNTTKLLTVIINNRPWRNPDLGTERPGTASVWGRCSECHNQHQPAYSPHTFADFACYHI
jgi:hypothetical protein